MKKRLVVLISGSGSNLQALIDACNSKALNAEIVAVFSNKADAYGLLRAQQAGIPALALSPAEFSSRDDFDAALQAQIDEYQPDLLILAGYMRILTPAFVRHYHGRMLNIHPSLLPKYPACTRTGKPWKTAMPNTVPLYILSRKSWTAARSFYRHALPFCRMILKTLSPPGYNRKNTASIRRWLTGLCRGVWH